MGSPKVLALGIGADAHCIPPLAMRVRTACCRQSAPREMHRVFECLYFTDFTHFGGLCNRQQHAV